MIYKGEPPPVLIISREFYSLAFLTLDTETSVTKKKEKKNPTKIRQNFYFLVFFRGCYAQCKVNWNI